MSMTDLDLFPSDSDAMPDPQFTTTRNGYNPREVEDFIRRMADQIETLKGDVKRMERALRQAQAEGESARQHHAAARAEVYEEFAARMAELLRTADDQADRVKQEADEEASKQLTEASQQAEKTIHDANAEADRVKWEGLEAVRRARMEAEKVVQEITSFRRSVRGELQALHERLITVVEELGATIELPEADTSSVASISAEPPPNPQPPAASPIGERSAVKPPAQERESQVWKSAAPAAPEGRSEGEPEGAVGGTSPEDSDSGSEQGASATSSSEEVSQPRSDAPDLEADDLLGTVQGFDLVLPEFSEEPDES
jgi:cell division septum initiation protein DivIVA